MMTIKELINKVKFLVVISVLTFTFSCGQQKRYVSYKVQEGETMHDIAERLDVKTQDLLRLNPDVGRNPATNTVIIIPNPNTQQKNSTPKIVKREELDTENTPQPTDIENEITEPIKKDSLKVGSIKTEYTTHIVQPKETVYFLTKQYNISKDELLKLNPEYPELKDNKLSIGQVLKVKAIETYISFEEELKNYITHTVKPKETLYSLTRFYNVSKEELINLNPHLPNLKDNQLNINDILKIKPIEEKSIFDENIIYTDSIQVGNPINLTMLLPFRADEYNSIKATEIYGKNKRSNRNNAAVNLANMVTDFYMGAEIAIDSIQKQGVDVNVKVFDTGNRGKNIFNILENNNLNEEDAIIGPFYSNQAKVVANRVKSPVIFPHFSSKQENFSSSKLVKTSPDTKVYVDKLTSYLKEKYNGETIFIIGDNKTSSNSQISSIVSKLNELDSISDKINILKPKKGYIEKTRFTKKMKPKTHCWVIMTSNDKVVVADALNSMIVLPEDVTVQVFAVNKNDSYDKIDNNKLARIEFAYVTNDFVDDNDELTKAFNKKYREKNHSLPSEYATKGFDITYDILMRLASGNKLNKTFKMGTSIRVANKFNYRKKLFSSTSNNGLFIVKYNNDLSLTRLR